jgi:hypothetical protein
MQFLEIRLGKSWTRHLWLGLVNFLNKQKNNKDSTSGSHDFLVWTIKIVSFMYKVLYYYYYY